MTDISHDMSDITYEVSPSGAFRVQPPERPAGAAPRPLGNRAQEKYDEMRRPQAAIVFRHLREAGEVGVAWRELWALGESSEPHEVTERWDVGPIIVWLRARNVDIEALYDVVAGETRFYLR